MPDPATELDERLLLLDPRDNVVVVGRRLAAGSGVRVGGETVVSPRDVALGHKLARRAISRGEAVLKYGAPIGVATRAIALGEHVHVHNIASAYTPTHVIPSEGDTP